MLVQGKVEQPPVTGTQLIARLALEALNSTSRNRQNARQLFKQWLRENDDLLEAVAGPSIDRAITEAIARDLREERRDVIRLSRAAHTVTNSVPVGYDPLPAPRRACIPVRSEAAAARAAANVMRYEGFVAFKLPRTGKMLGDAVAWEIADGFREYEAQRKGFAVLARFLKLVWQSLPDHEKPATEQQPLRKHMDAATLKALDERARIEEAKVIL